LRLAQPCRDSRHGARAPWRRARS